MKTPRPVLILADCTCNRICEAHPPRKATYTLMRRYLKDALGDLRILSGESVGPSTASWQGIAGTCAVNLKLLAAQLDQARIGNHEGLITFPNADDEGEG